MDFSAVLYGEGKKGKGKKRKAKDDIKRQGQADHGEVQLSALALYSKGKPRARSTETTSYWCTLGGAGRHD